MDTNKLYRAKPYIPEEDQKQILESWKEILETGMFISGKNVKAFEDKFAEYCGTDYAIATSTGATALEVALRATGIEGKKFLVPTQTFVASVSAIIRSNNIPVIVDIDSETQCLSPEIIESNLDDDVVGVMWVHMAGYIAPGVKEYCDKKGLILIEDASHAVGASISNTKAGNLGLAGCFSLFATKIITSGEGGMITTNDKSFADRCRIILNHGSIRNPSPVPGLDFGVECTYAASNYRMPEMSAVVGLSQIERVDEFVSKRNELAKHYHQHISNPRIKTMNIPSDTTMTWWQYIVTIEDSTLEERTAICKELLEDYNVPTANAYWPACHEQPAFREYVKEQTYPVADDILHRHIALPMYVEMSLEQVEYVAKAINRVVK